MLAGLLLFIPVLGLAIGAGMSALMGSMADVGIDDTFINKVRDQVTPGSSGLFVLSPDAAMDTIATELAVHQPVEVIFTHLSAEQERALRWVFTG